MKKEKIQDTTSNKVIGVASAMKQRAMLWKKKWEAMTPEQKKEWEKKREEIYKRMESSPKYRESKREPITQIIM